MLATVTIRCQKTSVNSSCETSGKLSELPESQWLHLLTRGVEGDRNILPFPNTSQDCIKIWIPIHIMEKQVSTNTEALYRYVLVWIFYPFFPDAEYENIILFCRLQCVQKGNSPGPSSILVLLCILHQGLLGHRF